MNLKLRSEVMRANDSNILYIARNLVCTGSNVFDTGFAPFSSANIDKNFKITIRMASVGTVTAQEVFLGCKYEGTLNGLSYPGIYFRRNGSKQSADIGGYNYYQPAISTLLGKNLYIWRKSGNWYAQIEGQTQRTLSVRSTTFDQNIVIGAGVQTNGTYFRYSHCNIDYVRIELI